MKTLSLLEIKKISQELQSFLDAKVQKCFVSDRGVGLEICKSNLNQYLWFEMEPSNPLLLSFKKIPAHIKLKKTSPLQLFAKAHLEGKRISEIHHREEFGRVIEFELGYEDPVLLEVRLFPHGANVILKSGNKHVAFDRIKEIKEGAVTAIDSGDVRNLAEISEQWLNHRGPKAKKETTPQELKDSLIAKKEKNLQKMMTHLEMLRDDHWQRLGEWLKENQSLDVPEEFRDFVDKQKSFSQNIQACFEKAKKNQEKIRGTLERIEILNDEIAHLKAKDLSGFAPLETQSKGSKKEDNWTGYRMSLNPKVEVFVGKNAQENLSVLRYAQSWDYWLHIKDYPGAHGIVRRPRNYEVSDEELRSVAQFVASKSKKSAHFLGPGDSFEVLVAECRFVRPIKGDKLGRVTYSNERVIMCKMLSK